MSQLLLYYTQRHVKYRVSGLAAVFLTCSTLLGQSNVSADLTGWAQKQVVNQFPETLNIEVTAKGTQQTSAYSNTVTIQELNHIVPEKARNEMEKAERARVKSQTDEAISHFNRAISIDPEYVAARNNLAAMYLITANPEPAVAQLEEAIKIDPHNPMLFKNLTMGYALINKFDAAERAGRVAVDLGRGGAQAYLLLGFALVKRHKFTEEALQCLERARDEYPLAHLLAGRVFIAQGKSESAKSEIETYLSSGKQEYREIAAHWLELIDESEQKSVAILGH